VEVEVKLYANLQDYLPEKAEGSNTFAVEMEPGKKLGDLIEGLGIPESEVKMVFVNNKKRQEEYEIQDGDIIAIFPPIAGG